MFLAILVPVLNFCRLIYFAQHVQGNVSIRGLHYAQYMDSTGIPCCSRDRSDWYAFQAPELENGACHDESVDLWSLGITICIALTGLNPFRGDG
jgi:hypothetical protein